MTRRIDGLDTMCRSCQSTRQKIAKELKKTAPNKPSECSCCGKIPNVWILDHDHNTGLFRGWICRNCNMGIGKLGDNLEGLQKAINYLSTNT